MTVFALHNADLWLGLSQNKQHGLMLELPVLSGAANGTLAFFHFLSLVGAGFEYCLSATSVSLSVLPVLVKCVARSLLLTSCRKVTCSVLLLLSQTNTTFLLTHKALTNIWEISNQCLNEWSYKMPEDSREGEREAPTMYPKLNWLTSIIHHSVIHSVSHAPPRFWSLSRDCCESLF